MIASRLRVGLVLGLSLLLAGVARSATPGPDFTGVWMPVGTPPTLRADGGGRPPLLPDADRTFNERQALKAPQRRTADPLARCLPPGMPRIFLQRMPFEVLQESSALTVLFQWNHRLRVVELGQTHEKLPMPGAAYDGYPVGRFAGDQMLVDSIGFNDATWLDDAGLPHGDKLHLIERWWLDDGGQRLNITFEVNDPANYSDPWQFTLNFRRLPRTTAIEEDVCVERQGLVSLGAAPAAAAPRPARVAPPAAPKPTAPKPATPKPSTQTPPKRAP